MKRINRNKQGTTPVIRRRKKVEVTDNQLELSLGSKRRARVTIDVEEGTSFQFSSGTASSVTNSVLTQAPTAQETPTTQVPIDPTHTVQPVVTESLAVQFARVMAQALQNLDHNQLKDAISLATATSGQVQKLSMALHGHIYHMLHSRAKHR